MHPKFADVTKVITKLVALQQAQGVTKFFAMQECAHAVQLTSPVELRERWQLLLPGIACQGSLQVTALDAQQVLQPSRYLRLQALNRNVQACCGNSARNLL